MKSLTSSSRRKLFSYRMGLAIMPVISPFIVKSRIHESVFLNPSPSSEVPYPRERAWPDKKSSSSCLAGSGHQSATEEWILLQIISVEKEENEWKGSAFSLLYESPIKSSRHSHMLPASSTETRKAEDRILGSRTLIKAITVRLTHL